jgi:hypothetical protein
MMRTPVSRSLSHMCPLLRQQALDQEGITSTPGVLLWW